MSAVTAQLRYKVEGMDCAGCATKINQAIRRLPGIEDISVSVANGSMKVFYHGLIDQPLLERTMKGLGYRITLQQAATNDKNITKVQIEPQKTRPISVLRFSKGQLILVMGLSLILAYASGLTWPAIESWSFLIAMVLGLIPITYRAVMAARSGVIFSIEMLMSIAAIGAVIIGAVEEAAVVVLLFLLGEWLEGLAASRARKNIQGLVNLLPKTALREIGEKVEEIPAIAINIDDIILVRSGERIPADGLIITGESEIDEAFLTGESKPKYKHLGDPTFAGTVNGHGTLRIRVTANAADNTIARIIKLVEEAQESKAPTERFIERFSHYYMPLLIVVAALTAVLPPLLTSEPWSEWIYKGLAVLLIGCPCALVISTPAAIAAALSAGARRGLLIKGGAVLENIGKVNMVAFDKTGTLTEGKPTITDIIPYNYTPAEILSFAAALETGTSHPLAAAILARAKVDNITPVKLTEITTIAGQGISGRGEDGTNLFIGSAAAAKQANLTPTQITKIQELNEAGKTVAVLVIDKDVAGIIGIRDEPRADAKLALDLLSRLGIQSIMLTGDNGLVAKSIAQKIGLEVQAELMPSDKLKMVTAMKKKGLRVAKVGDGINDAPALAAADIGIAMGGGTDVALETADAAILHNRLVDVANMIKLSRRTLHTIRQNIAVALGFKAVFLITTIIGLTGLWPAILADTGATILVTINSLKLLFGNTSKQ